ncbi:MAG TPA: hypothetical protein VJK52_00210, partial [Candidatus Nanoarchaeia archaeon]|nr:hypothetical protein [Candidatus Nanoarchaeia archaeon]
FRTGFNSSVSSYRDEMSISGTDGEYLDLVFDAPSEVTGMDITLKPGTDTWIVVRGVDAEGAPVTILDQGVIQSGRVAWDLPEGTKVTVIDIGRGENVTVHNLLGVGGDKVTVTGMEAIPQPWETVTEAELAAAQENLPAVLESFLGKRSFLGSVEGREGQPDVQAQLRAVTASAAKEARLLRALLPNSPEISSALREIPGLAIAPQVFLENIAEGNFVGYFIATGNGSGVAYVPTLEERAESIRNAMLNKLLLAGFTLGQPVNLEWQEAEVRAFLVEHYAENPEYVVALDMELGNANAAMVVAAAGGTVVASANTNSLPLDVNGEVMGPLTEEQYIQYQLSIAMDSYSVADTGQFMLDTGLNIAEHIFKSKVISTARSLIPTIIEAARTTQNGMQYLRSQIWQTANTLKRIAEQMVLTGEEMGQDMINLTQEGLRALYENNPQRYFALINEAKKLSVDRADARNGADVNDNNALAEYHRSLSGNVTNAELNIFDHVEGDGRHQGKLVVLILGNFQHLGDSEAGLYQIARERSIREGFEVLTFRVGDLWAQVQGGTVPYKGFELHPSVVLEHTRNIIEDRMQRRGIFAGMPEISEVGSEQYSRGGGTADVLFGTEENVRAILGDARLKAAANIDGVSLLGGSAVSRRPAADYFYNVYQENTHSSIDLLTDATPIVPNALPYIDFTQGQPVRGQYIAGAENLEQSDGLSESHVSIDEKHALEGILFILGKLSENEN